MLTEWTTTLGSSLGAAWLRGGAASVWPWVRAATPHPLVTMAWLCLTQRPPSSLHKSRRDRPSLPLIPSSSPPPVPMPAGAGLGEAKSPQSPLGEGSSDAFSGGWIGIGAAETPRSTPCGAWASQVAAPPALRRGFVV